MHMCVCLRYGLLSKRATGLQLPWREHWIRNVNWRTDSPSIISYTHTHTHVHMRLGQGVFPYAAQTPGLSWLDSVWYEWEGSGKEEV